VQAPILALMAVGLAGCSLPGGLAAAADARPGRLVSLPDGRRLNLVCTGRGSPTVLLESGFGATAGAWYKVQPPLARTTRVCAYDRAGSGFSDPGPLPRDGAGIARDLDQALTAAKIGGPYVVVGHSAGGLYARLFAARRQGQVVGLVLLDPTVERRAPQPAGDGLDGIRRRVQRCLTTSETKPQPPLTDAQWDGCVSVKSGLQAIKLAQRPDAWRNQLSELDNIFGRTSDQVLRSHPLLRTVPTYVITASQTAAAAPSYGFDRPRSIVELQHEAIARMSEAGSQQTVVSSHLVMFDRPEVVVVAVEEMLRAHRAGRPPYPLLSSETDQPVADELFPAPDATGDMPTATSPETHWSGLWKP
jgi:pimeloyl-ACP methyl ester carboxylesterase